MTRYKQASLEQRFWSKVRISGPDECWNWVASKGRGYGKIKWRGRDLIASRVAYELCIGRIPQGLYVLHRCDNRACCNPTHLFLGTHQDNMDDMIAKGRQVHHGARVFGFANGATKLSDDQVRQVRVAPGSQSAIAERYGISQSLVSLIRRGLQRANVQ